MNSANEWREFYQTKGPGAIAICRSPLWLRDGGCPRCDNHEFEVTEDCWAYCTDCGKGYPTEYPFNRAGERISIINQYTEF